MSLTVTRRALAAGVLLAAIVVVPAAAQSPSASPGVSPDSGPVRTVYPLTIDNCGVSLTFDAPPERVLILNGTSVGEVESFILLGLESSIAANAQSYGISDDPEMVARIAALPTGGLSLNKNFDVPVEQVLAAAPDLVVSTWSGGFDPKMGFASREQLATAGINSLVNPVNCAFGKPDATPEEQATLAAASVQSTYEFLTLLGQVFDVQDRATALEADLQARIDAIQAKVGDLPAKKVLLTFPDMSMMSDTGLPAVMTGGIYDDVIRLAGGVNSFAGKSIQTTQTITKEELAAADVDVLVIGAFMPGEDLAAAAASLFAEYPQWSASKTGTYTTVSDGVWLGPVNAWAIEALARAAHPDAF